MLSSQRLWPRLWSNWVAFIISPPQRFGLIVAREQCGQFIVNQIADPLHRQIRGRISGDGLRVVSVLTLTRKYGRYTVTPDFLDGVQDARLVVHENIMLGRVTLLDVIQRLFLVNINEHVTVYSFKDAGAFDLARLKHHVAVRENDGRPPGAEPLKHVE